jgi:hypothetical protein
MTIISDTDFVATCIVKDLTGVIFTMPISHQVIGMNVVVNQKTFVRAIQVIYIRSNLPQNPITTNQELIILQNYNFSCVSPRKLIYICSCPIVENDIIMTSYHLFKVIDPEPINNTANALKAITDAAEDPPF